MWIGLERKEGRKFACEQYTCVVFGTRGRRAVRKASHRMDVYVTVIPHDGVGEFHAFISSRMSFSRTNLRLQFISLPLCRVLDHSLSLGLSLSLLLLSLCILHILIPNLLLRILRSISAIR